MRLLPASSTRTIRLPLFGHAIPLSAGRRIMGSTSDSDTLQPACDVLDELGIPYETRIVPAVSDPGLDVRVYAQVSTCTLPHKR